MSNPDPTPPDPPRQEGRGALTEEALREAVDWITDRSPHWDQRNMVAVQRLNMAITELVELRQQAAARTALADAALAYGQAHAARIAERDRLHAINYQGDTATGAAYSALMIAEADAQDAFFAAYAADVAVSQDHREG